MENVNFEADLAIEQDATSKQSKTGAGEMAYWSKSIGCSDNDLGLILGTQTVADSHVNLPPTPGNPKLCSVPRGYMHLSGAQTHADKTT